MKTLWRLVASSLLALGGALIGMLLATRRSPGLASQRQRGAEGEKRVADIEARRTESQQAVVAEHKKQRELAQEAMRVEEQLNRIEAHVKGLSHDNLDAEIHRALDGAPGASAAPGVVKPSGVIKPAN